MSTQTEINNLIRSNIDLTIDLIKKNVFHDEDVLRSIVDKYNNNISYAMLFELEEYNDQLSNKEMEDMAEDFELENEFTYSKEAREQAELEFIKQLLGAKNV